MKKFILAIALLLNAGNSFAEENLVCAQNAEALAKAVYNTGIANFPDLAIQGSKVLPGIKTPREDYPLWTYEVQIFNGGHMPMRYSVVVQESGPNNCGLRSLSILE